MTLTTLAVTHTDDLPVQNLQGVGESLNCNSPTGSHPNQTANVNKNINYV